MGYSIYIYISIYIYVVIKSYAEMLVMTNAEQLFKRYVFIAKFTPLHLFKLLN